MANLVPSERRRISSRKVHSTSGFVTQRSTLNCFQSFTRSIISFPSTAKEHNNNSSFMEDRRAKDVPEPSYFLFPRDFKSARKWIPRARARCIGFDKNVYVSRDSAKNDISQLSRIPCFMTKPRARDRKRSRGHEEREGSRCARVCP